MRTRLFWLLLLPVVLLGAPVRPTPGEDVKGNPADEAAILKNAEAFVEAFHKGDAAALAAFWTPDGDYTDQTGHLRKGREAIEKLFARFFAEHKGMKLRIDVTSLRFVTPDVAVEDGTTAVIPPDGAPPSRARYTNVHTRKDGKWFLSSVRDAAHSPPTNYQHLRRLEWAIGEWAEEGKAEAARATFAWAQNQNFIVSTFTTAFKNLAIGGGTQWIAVDPQTWGLRSWTFESNGSFGEATWDRDEERWTITSKTVMPDGKKVTATTSLTHPDPDTLVLVSKNRTLDGKAIPDGREIRMKRISK